MRRFVCLITGLTPACEDCLDRRALDEVATILGGSASVFACRGRNLVGTYVALADVARAKERIREARRRLQAAQGNRLGYMSQHSTYLRAVSSMSNTLRRRERELLAVMAGLTRERYTEFPR